VQPQLTFVFTYIPCSILTIALIFQLIIESEHKGTDIAIISLFAPQRSCPVPVASCNLCWFSLLVRVFLYKYFSFAGLEFKLLQKV